MEMEISKANAYPQNIWTVMGTAGSLTGSFSELTWKYVDFASMPQRPVDRSLARAGRQYNSEALEFTEEIWKATPEDKDIAGLYYKDLFQTLRHGQPQTVTPQSVRRQIHVIQRCHDLAGF